MSDQPKTIGEALRQQGLDIESEPSGWEIARAMRTKPKDEQE